MRAALPFCVVVLSLCSVALKAQDARAGFDVRAVFSAQTAESSLSTNSPRRGLPATAGYRLVLYPTWKFTDNWSITAALQSVSRPYFRESLSTKNYGIEDNILQGTLNYSLISDKGSLQIRVGELSSAFGSFLLRYDDANNPLVGMPTQYGYYYKPVSTLGLAGAQIDTTRHKWDGRLQVTNSSPANPRSIFTSDQYLNWTVGGGYAIRQGLRVGASFYRGPYLYRQYPFFFPGEGRPKSLPAHATGFDVEWARGHWNAQGEWQSFLMPYKLLPDFHEQAGYGEVKRVLNARWYVAQRSGYLHSSSSGYSETFEEAVGFRPDRLQVIKAGYELQHFHQGAHALQNTFTVQLVTAFHLFSLARN